MYENTNVPGQSPEVFYDKVVLQNFSKLTGKRLCQSLFFNKVAGLRPGILLKNRLRHRCFPVNFESFKNIFFTEHFQATAFDDIYLMISS